MEPNDPTKPTLKNWQSLLIRQCKKNKTSLRKMRKIVSKYGYRHNFKNDKSEDQFVLKALLDIWETYVKPNRHTQDIFWLISNSHPSMSKYEYDWIDGVERVEVQKWHGKVMAPSDHFQRIIVLLVSEICTTEIRFFNGFKVSARWRKNKEQ